MTLIPGVKLNFGMTGMSLSTGVPGFRKTIHTSGRVTTSVGIPGTGVSYVTTENKSKSAKTDTSERSSNTQAQNTYEAEPYTPPSAPVYPVLEPSRTEAQSNVARVNGEMLRNIHKSVDEAIDWTEILVSDTPPDENIYNRELWNYCHAHAYDVLNGNIDTYLQVISELNPLNDLLEFGSGFECGTDSPNRMEVEFRVKSSELMPSKSSMATQDYYDLLQDYVCSCALRVARDILALLPVGEVIVHAEDGAHTILSACFDRKTMMGIKFSFTDPSDTVAKFEHRMKFDLQSGFSAVDRIEK